MACKTYKTIYEENKEYIESTEDFEKLYEEMRAMEFADKADLYQETKVQVMDILNTARPYYKGQRIEFVSITPNDGTFDIEYKYLTSDTVYPVNVGGYGQFDFSDDSVQFGVTANELTKLYSDYDFVLDGQTGYKETAVDVVNNPEKILEIAEEVAELDEVKIESWHKDELMSRLKDVTTVFRSALPEINVKLNAEGAKNGGGITFDGSKATVYVNVGPRNENKSALEVYTHEMIHAITKFAIESRDPKLSEVVRGIKEIKNRMLEDEKTEGQLAEMMPNQATAKDDAKKMMDYLADKEVGLHEFVAYAMTNPYVMAKLASMTPKKVEEEYPDLASKLVGWIREMYALVVDYVKRAPKSKNAYETMMSLTHSLAMANNRVQEAKRTGTIGKIIEQFGGFESKITEKMEEYGKKVTDSPLPKRGKGVLGAATYLAKIGARSLVDENVKRSTEISASLMGLKPEGTLQTIVRDMSESDGTQDDAEKAGLKSQMIDQTRENTYIGVAGQLKTAFERELEQSETEALTATVLDTDLSTIWYRHRNKMEGLLADEAKLQGEIDKVETRLKGRTDQKSFNLYRDQASGLGYYMVTGKGHLAQMLNARNIAMKLNTKLEDRDVSEQVVQDIDELATLYAIKETDKASKDTLVDLMTSEANGVEMLVAYQMAHKDKVEGELFNTDADKFKMIKGYSKEVFDRDVDYQIAPVNDEQRMRRLGFKKLDRKLGRHALDKNPVEMAMYVSTIQVKQDLHRVALRYTDTARRGTTIRESYAMGGMEFGSIAADRDIDNMVVEMVKITNAQANGTYDSDKVDYGIVPTLNNAGNVADFRYMMDKEDKVETLKMERRAFHVMGRTYASTYDKKESMKFNEELMEEIIKDAAENLKGKGLIGENNKEYIDITRDSTNEEVKDIWSVLPDNIKKKYPKGFKVRRDLMHSYLGYRELSMADFPGFKNMGETARYATRVAEKIWKEIVKIAKVDIILRVPAVLIGNVTSNFMYSVMSGYSPLEVAKLQLQGVKDLNEFIKGTKQVIDLENLIRAGRAPKNAERKLAALKNDLNNNTAKDLVDEGFYMSIIEELGLEEFQTSSRVGDFVDDKLKGFPEFVRDGAHLLYITDKTKIFKTMNTATQYSDFVARYAQYHLMVRKGVDKEVAIKTVRDAFINYNKPNSRLVEWANQMGFIMFTKYFTRIQKAIKDHGKKNPAKVAFALLGQEFLTGDVEDIYDQSMVSKDMGNIVYNPLDHILRVVTPSGAEAVQAVLQQVK